MYIQRKKKIYIYIERERERERCCQSGRRKEKCVALKAIGRRQGCDKVEIDKNSHSMFMRAFELRVQQFTWGRQARNLSTQQCAPSYTHTQTHTHTHTHTHTCSLQPARYGPCRCSQWTCTGNDRGIASPAGDGAPLWCWWHRKLRPVLCKGTIHWVRHPKPRSQFAIQVPDQLMIMHPTSLFMHRTPLFMHPTPPFMHPTPLLMHRTSLFMHRTPLFMHRTLLFMHCTPLFMHRTPLFASGRHKSGFVS